MAPAAAPAPPAAPPAVLTAEPAPTNAAAVGHYNNIVAADRPAFLWYVAWFRRNVTNPNYWIGVCRVIASLRLTMLTRR
ncbi:uncharacterized protein BDZ99DRAFT_458532 [Mytilinidion resinicola]|uniref:Uncharacterized protein n=1 Tax=Mytilinidion resinicola TaxID=574789 RepID=A0A6A6Z7M6_9PEZI|nr:uncharacterized protein BDZ99DRAFT_458532 [Mytilinidion resinicola]KAF2816693.1 hypothetical protein BDZ99DRAFT_458532 [Mytilinidion resinicola]